MARVVESLLGGWGVVEDKVNAMATDGIISSASSVIF